MSEPAPEYKIKRGKGRPSNGDYPKKVFARLSEAQHAYLKDKYGDVSKGIRALIDADMSPPPGRMVVTINPTTAAIIQAERKPAANEGVEPPY